MEKYKRISYEEVISLIGKILCEEFGLCPVETKIEKIPDEAIPILKVGNRYIQWTPKLRAYRVWGNDGSFIGIAKTKDYACKLCKPWSDGKYYGLREEI